MSRTTLCTLTASGLVLLSLGTMLLRYQVLGDEVRRPLGPATWKVTLAVQGTSLGRAQLKTAGPLDLDRQHLLDDSYSSEQLNHKPAGGPQDRQGRRERWWQRAGTPPGPFKARAEFHIGLRINRLAGTRQSTGPYSPPHQGEYLGSEQLIEANHERISTLARQLTSGLAKDASPLDVAQALFHFPELKIRNDVRFDGPAVSAVGCLEAGSGDRSAKSRLLVALLRNRNIPARVLTGVTLAKGSEQPPHYWVEAWIHDHWLPMCPFHRLFGRVPSTYLVLGFGDRPVVSGRSISDLKCAFLIDKQGREEALAAEESAWKRAFKGASLALLPTEDRKLVEILLLLPLAALIICIFRNIIGMNSFGTFAPALIGLAFHRELKTLPGILVFVTILLVGWAMRRVLDHYHLLQVPRVSLMLTLIMSVLIGLVVVCNRYDAGTSSYISLFPLVILTGMVERFWTLETEDSVAASFKTLLQTMFIATVIALVLSRPWVLKHLFCFPETLGLVMAGQLLIGRYTGYRLTELFRFRDFLRQPPAVGGYTTE
jgi:hypothetical protein